MSWAGGFARRVTVRTGNTPEFDWFGNPLRPPSHGSFGRLVGQLDLFDTVMEEDRKDAVAAGGHDTHTDPLVVEDKGTMPEIAEEEDVDDKVVDVPVLVEVRPDPPAVQSIRLALEKLADEAETENMLVIIAEKLERMANAHCGIAQWKKIRCAMSLGLAREKDWLFRHGVSPKGGVGSRDAPGFRFHLSIP